MERGTYVVEDFNFELEDEGYEWMMLGMECFHTTLEMLKDE